MRPYTTPAPFDFEPLPLEAWKASKDTLHLYAQIVGKIRMEMFPPLNHWWHVTLYVSTRGLTTRPIPYDGGTFEIEFDFIEHVLRVSTSLGTSSEFALHHGLSVANFYANITARLTALDINVSIRAIPYEAPTTEPFETDLADASYDAKYVQRYWQTLVGINNIFEEFRGRFIGKSTPVHMFWHSFDLALTRFSGKRVPTREGAHDVERKAYSHEVLSFGFWAGDDNTPAPAFYMYAAPEPADLATEPIRPDSAKWGSLRGGAMALFMYEDFRNSTSPREALLEFLESTYQAGAKRAGWDTAAFTLDTDNID